VDILEERLEIRKRGLQTHTNRGSLEWGGGEGVTTLEEKSHLILLIGEPFGPERERKGFKYHSRYETKI